MGPLLWSQRPRRPHLLRGVAFLCVWTIVWSSNGVTAALSAASSSRVVGIARVTPRVHGGGWGRARALHRDTRIPRQVIVKADRRPHAGRTGGALRLKDSVFNPARENPKYDYAETPSVADVNWFRANHSRTYVQLGMRSGYYERADMSDSIGRRVYFHWQPSIFGTVAEAIAAFRDAVSRTKTYTQATENCADVFATRCFLATYNMSSGKTETYEIVQVHRCIGESSDTESRSDLSLADIATIASRLHVAGEAVLEHACK